jgi:hypothetical protein
VVPAADSGTEYKTLDARCRACVVMGGEEGPCVPDTYLEAEEKQSGYPCPRREWENVDHPTIAQLVMLGAQAEQGHLFRLTFDVAFGDASKEEQRRVLSLLTRAYGDEIVRMQLWPKGD